MNSIYDAHKLLAIYLHRIYEGAVHDTPETAASRCREVFILDDDWQRFKEAVNSYD